MGVAAEVTAAVDPTAGAAPRRLSVTRRKRQCYTIFDALDDGYSIYRQIRVRSGG
jgi:hypothetical protein